MSTPNPYFAYLGGGRPEIGETFLFDTCMVPFWFPLPHGLGLCGGLDKPQTT